MKTPEQTKYLHWILQSDFKAKEKYIKAIKKHINVK
jgi:hypothetical protein